MTTLVTGASRGIGRALADRFAEAGHDVVLVARSEDDLREVADGIEDGHGVATHVMPTDLTDHDARERLHDQVQERDLAVDVLVNNAGFGNQGRFDAIDLEAEIDLFELNTVAVVHLTKLFIDDMLGRGEQGDGEVLNVASSAGFWPGPYMATYFASKSSVVSLSEALHEELLDTGVGVTALCPGPVSTEFWSAAQAEESGLARIASTTPDEVADRGYRAVQSRRTVVVPSLPFKLLEVASRFAPRAVQRKIAKRLNAGGHEEGVGAAGGEVTEAAPGDGETETAAEQEATD